MSLEIAFILDQTLIGASAALWAFHTNLCRTGGKVAVEFNSRITLEELFSQNCKTTEYSGYFSLTSSAKVETDDCICTKDHLTAQCLHSSFKPAKLFFMPYSSGVCLRSSAYFLQLPALHADIYTQSSHVGFSGAAV